MQPGHLVFSGTTKSGKPLTIRYIQESDLEALLEYINLLSQERTFIRFQGEEITREEEQKFLDKVIKTIRNKTAVVLTAICDGRLVGITEVSLGEKTEKHTGLFGITIKKEYRGEGIGKILMQLVIAEAKRNLAGLEIINLHVFGKNQLAMKMYQDFGFQEYGRLPNGIKLENGHDDCVMMYLPINPLI